MTTLVMAKGDGAKQRKNQTLQLSQQGDEKKKCSQSSDKLAFEGGM